jgi:hypothetical protein
MNPAPHANQKSGRRGRHPWLTAVLLILSAAVALPLFGALYRGFDVFGFPGALGVLIAIGLVLAVAWFVHLIRTFGEPFVAVIVSVATSVGHGLREDPYIVGAERRLAAPTARPKAFVRRRMDPHNRTGSRAAIAPHTRSRQHILITSTSCANGPTAERPIIEPSPTSERPGIDDVDRRAGGERVDLIEHV